MPTTLKKMLEVYEPKAGDEKKFKDKHIVVKTKDTNGNGDDVFTGSNVKAINRKEEKHGYNAGEDEKVYEEVEEDQEQIDELSKSTLASYAKKATRDARLRFAQGKDFERISKSSRKPEYKAGAKEWEDKYKSDARKREAGVNKAVDRLAKEQVEIQEGDEAHAQFVKYHNESAKMLKNINTGLNKHYSNVTSKQGYNNGQAHWGHVGDIKHIHRQLQDIHDQILQTGEYAKPPQVAKLKEDVEIDDSTVRLLELYSELSEEHQQAMIEIIESGQSEELLTLIEEQING